MLAFDLLHRQLPHRVLRGWKMSRIDSGLVRVIPGDTKGREQSLELEEHCVLPGAYHIGQYSPGVMVKRMPQPSSSSFSPDETPHFIELGGAYRQHFAVA